MSNGRSDAEAVHSLIVNGRELPILIRRYAGARNYRLRYDAARQALRLSIPARGGMRGALDWARTQADWVARQMEKAPVMTRLVPGVVFPVEGVERRIDWSQARPRTPVLEENWLRLGGPEESVPARLVRWLRQRALATLREETLEIAACADLSVVNVAIGDPRGRWGSCSSDGSIRYSWRLILAPPEVRHATVAHEVAHLLHMDHSPAFHAAHRRLLDHFRDLRGTRIDPENAPLHCGRTDPRAAREWLRRHGADLHRFTA